MFPCFLKDAENIGLLSRRQTPLQHPPRFTRFRTNSGPSPRLFRPSGRKCPANLRCSRRFPRIRNEFSASHHRTVPPAGSKSFQSLQRTRIPQLRPSRPSCKYGTRSFTARASPGLVNAASELHRTIAFADSSHRQPDLYSNPGFLHLQPNRAGVSERKPP